MPADLTAPIFTDEDKAREHFEALRWPDGRVCPHCEIVGNSTLLQGKSTRPGLYKCKSCRKPFTATMGTVYEKSHIPLHKWLLATHLMCASKKGISAHQLFRMLGFGSYRTAWFMAHRIREAMTTDVGALPPLGGDGAVVEVDETFIGQKTDVPKRRGYAHKHVVLTLVERGGSARSFHVNGTSAADLLPIIRANVAPDTYVMTDEAGQYVGLSKHFTGHEFVRHGKGEYVRKDVHTNTAEGFYSVFKRGMKGVYQHCSEKHLHRYVAEFDFRYTERSARGVSDKVRAEKAIKGTVGKRLIYRHPDRNQVAA